MNVEVLGSEHQYGENARLRQVGIATPVQVSFFTLG